MISSVFGVILSTDDMDNLPFPKKDYELAHVVIVRGHVVKNAHGLTTSEVTEQRIEAAYHEGKANPRRDLAIRGIAQRTLALSTLESRMSDRLDFHDLGVISIRRALEEAYEAGKASK